MTRLPALALVAAACVTDARAETPVEALQAAGALWLDPGAAEGGAPAPFSPCDGQRCADPRATWVTPPHAAIGGSWPDELTGDALTGGALHLDLPAGAWVAFAMMGREPLTLDDVDSPWGLGVPGVEPVPPTLSGPDGLASSHTEAWPTFRPGETAWDRTLGLAHRWTPFRLDVPEGGVTLRPQGRPLQALLVVPAALADVARDALREVDAARAAWWLDHHAPDQRGLAPPPMPGGPLRAWATGWVGGPPPVDAPTPPEATLRLAADERGGLVLWMPDDRPVRVEVSAPPDVDVDLWEVGWLDAAQHSSRPLRPRPTLLRPLDGAAATLTAGQGAQAAVALTLTPSTPGAERDVHVTLTRGHERARFTVHVRAAPFSLPASPVAVGWNIKASAAAVRVAGQRGELDAALAPGGVVDQRLADDLDRARLLGADALNLGGALLGGDFPAHPERAAARAERWIAAWADRGGRLVTWVDPKAPIRWQTFLGTGRELPADLVGPVGALMDVARRAPIRVVTTFWEEEAGFHNATADQIAARLVPQLRAAFPGVALSATTGHPLDWRISGLYDVVMMAGLPHLKRSDVEAVRARGSEVWAYNLAPGRTGPLIAWAAGVPALLQWHWSPQAFDPFLDAHRQPIWFYAGVGPDGRLWHTLLAESMAQGITDIRWLALLERWADEAEAAGRAPEAVAHARAVLAATRGALDGALNPAAWDGELLAPTASDALREAVMDATWALRPPITR